MRGGLFCSRCVREVRGVVELFGWVFHQRTLVLRELHEMEEL